MADKVILLVEDNPNDEALTMRALKKSGVANEIILGCNSYIRKPVDFTQFTESVRQLGLYWLVLNESLPMGRT
jgi:hypothetical protein